MTTDLRKDHKRLQDNLRLLVSIHTAAKLSKVLNVSLKTWHNRMKEPWKYFSFDDFWLLSRYCRISFTDLLDGEIKIR